jgi:hypothetical protein
VKTVKTLGTPTCDALELMQEARLGAEQLHDAAMAERQRRIDAGVSDDVEDDLTFNGPPLTTDALTSKRLEVCWGGYRVEGKEGRTKMWCPCKVLRVADGETAYGRHGQAESARARKLLPAGAVLVEWEPDHERGEHHATVMWLVLHPDRWAGRGASGHLAWRWDPRDMPSQSAGPSARRARRE